MRHLWIIPALWLLGPTARSEGGRPARVSLEDPVSDDHGPGRYTYPTDGTLYRRGTFDLRRFEVEVQGDSVLFHVTLGEPIRAPAIAKASNASEIRLENSIYLQNVDIHIDTGPGPGETESIPGRNVTFDPEEAWDVAVVLTPQPFATRSMLDGWKPVRRVLFPTNVRAKGSRVTARVPMHELGGLPEAHWGYQVLVSGATWGASFDVVNRYALGHPINALTMPVTTVPETDKFGGGELSFLHPYVIDALAPEGLSQRKMLSSYDPEAKRRAVVRMVYPDPAAREKALEVAGAATPTPPQLEPGPVELSVKNVEGELVVLERKDQAPIEPYQIGVVFDGDRELGRVVVTSVHPAFVLTTAVEGLTEVRPGFVVRFTPKPKAD